LHSFVLDVSAIIFESDEAQLHFVCELYDKCQEVFVHFVDFFGTSTSPGDLATFANQLPSLYELCSKYHLSPESAFAIVRPVLHLDHICSVSYFLLLSFDLSMYFSYQVNGTDGLAREKDASDLKNRDAALLDTCRRLIPADTCTLPLS
jgi:hypothetical protein